MRFLRVSETIVCAGGSIISFWDPKTWNIQGKYKSRGEITSMDTSPVLGLVATGTSLGYVRLFTAASSKDESPQIILKQRMHSKSVINVR